MPFLFDTDAISELLKPRPAPDYVAWIENVPRQDQFISAITVGELYRGCHESTDPQRYLASIEGRVMPGVTVLSFDTAIAQIYGMISADLRKKGRPLAEIDLQIAATALRHHLPLVTGNIRHFARVPGLTVNPILAESRRSR